MASEMCFTASIWENSHRIYKLLRACCKVVDSKMGGTSIPKQKNF